ncbi:phospholipase/carboxylesterase family protein [Cryptosporidium muris RN66]|uniref:Phospholipase/carboxylesterase family protein n=1 Tax=Cryptosporidium muris (strain RN66) TaxID=441375 RepID=B6AJJ1_CRYMR|nr:phospholipase/carboxylesterase family protein [Cryptosporidium muris RN66]EEA08382.1 phospholipase/carboxylesterase family protein [Cryptosporidium muris RN66]|eukprot:XP_002142731.1 phospholipase/carboxylesterase family protein [Cryptosporidium muris RN66]
MSTREDEDVTNLGIINVNDKSKKLPKVPIVAAFCCLTILGLRKRITNAFTFVPPKRSGLILKTLSLKSDINQAVLFTKYKSEQIFIKALNGNQKQLSLLASGLNLNIYLIWLPSGRSKIPISCLHIIPTGEDIEDPQLLPLIIFSHGNATDIGYISGWLIRLSAKLKMQILAYDYRGYGISFGKPSENGIIADIKSVYKYACNELKIPTQKIFLLGQSIGSAPSLSLAVHLSKKQKKLKDDTTRRLLGGIIIQSGILSGLNALLAPEFNISVPFDVFKNYKGIKKIVFPIMLCHGLNDQIINIENAFQLYKSAKKNVNNIPITVWWIDGANHNDLEIVAKQEYFQRIRSFIEESIDIL